MDAKKCPECGATELSWHVGMCRDAPIFYAGCDVCSETLNAISLEVASDLLTKYANSEIKAGK